MKKNSIRGFSLLELMISLIILTIGLLSVAMIFPLGLKASQEADRLTVCTMLAQQRIEDIKRGEKNIWNPSVAIPPYDGATGGDGLLERRWYNGWDGGTNTAYYEDIAETAVGEVMPRASLGSIPPRQFGWVQNPDANGNPNPPDPARDDPYYADNAGFTNYSWLASVERLSPEHPESILQLTVYIFKTDAQGRSTILGPGYREEKFVTYLVKK